MTTDGRAQSSPSATAHSNAPQVPGSPSGEPVAVVGMACRFPLASDVSAFWRLLEAGRNAVTEGVPGSGVGRIGELFRDVTVQNEACRFAAFIDDVDRFDAPFFRISPVEAQHLDPQQRLMLETSWQALEDAGIDPDALAGSRTGVYGGVSNNEYRSMIMEASNTSEPASSLYTVSGTSYNTAIGRVSFALGLRGPAIALDTACSSSLVAIHQAVTGLQHGETDLALAGGVHTILSGRLLELRGNAGMLAPDGRCKTFDASADGYVRGEGCGIIVLKRLSDAEADGDRIWGVIRGTAINQDGASQGLTVPNGDAQQAVIEDALARSGVLPSHVDYVEAHGTGTPVGDPIELEAVAAAYGRGRSSDRPLLIGSVKTNFGHLESAAGVAGVMKVLLSMNKGVIPRHLNFNNPTPAVDWSNLPLRVTAQATEWPDADGHAPLAGVSGFGWSGTNAHVVIEGYRPTSSTPGQDKKAGWPAGPARPVAGSDSPAPASRPRRMLPLSGKTDQALRETAARYHAWLDERSSELPPDATAASPLLSDLAWTASVGRSHFGHRAGIAFSDADSLRAGLRDVVDGSQRPAVDAAKVAFVYTGQGSQWYGMGKALYESEPVVREVLDRCERVMLEERDASLLDVMFGAENAAGDLYDTAWSQPSVYALECALTALWRSIGVEPSVAIGHSLGEFAAAQAAGVFSLEDGLRFVAKRGELLSSVPVKGTMAAIFASPEPVAAAVDEHNAAAGSSDVSVAVDNGIHQVISGTEEAVKAVSDRFEADDIMVRPLRNQAFHSPLLEPALDDLEQAFSPVPVSPPSLSLVSNVTGKVVAQDEPLDGGYWRRHARNAVQFRKGIGEMAAMGVDLVIEIGPHAVLGPLVALVWHSVADGMEEPAVLQSMLRPSSGAFEEDANDGFVDAVAAAYGAGLSLDFTGLFAGEKRRRIALPGYPFQRERHWIDPPARRRSAMGHPLLGLRHESPRGEVAFESDALPTDPAWLDDHRVYGRVIMPGAFYGAAAAAAALVEGSQAVELEDVQFQTAMVFAEGEDDDSPDPGGRNIQAVLGPTESGGRKIEIFSRGESEEAWTLHAEGRMASASSRGAPGRVDVESLKQGLESRDVAEFYRARAEANIALGPAFRTLRAIWSGDGRALGEVTLPDALDGDSVDPHPVLLDGCLQVLSAARQSAGGGNDVTYLPFGWERLWLGQQAPRRLLCLAQLRETVGAADDTPEVLSGDLTFYTTEGVEVGGISGYAVKRATRAALLSSTEGLRDLLYETVWRDRPLAEGMPAADFLQTPSETFARTRPFAEYLADEGVGIEERAGVLDDLERMSWCYALAALDKLGWTRRAGDYVESEPLRERLGVLPEHRRLFRRILELLVRAGVAEQSGEGFVVKTGQGNPLPDGLPSDVDEHADGMLERYWHGETEIGLFRRCAAALAEVLRGDADPLTLLFSSGEPTAGDLYLKAPVARAANRMLADVVATLVAGLPQGRRLRILEVGAGTGAATAAMLPELPEGRYDYVYTDISAGFFSEAESRFGGTEKAIEYRVLDIEKDPIAQGFDLHGYDLVVASNVLHATRYLNVTLDNCRRLLAPSGQLVALENLRGQGWQDLTFGQLDGWWRFADDYRLHHALADPGIWKRALADAAFGDTAVIGVAKPGAGGDPDRGVILSQGPARIEESAGVWVLAADRNGVADALAESLSARNQTVVVARAEHDGHTAGVSLDVQDRKSWRSLLENLPSDVPLGGVVHLAALDGHGAAADTGQFADDAQQHAGSALALVQGIADADATPANGVWFVTRGGQVLEHEHLGQLTGAMLWGFGKVVAREASHLQPRMIDLDPAGETPVADLVNELMYPDAETHVAYRLGLRQAARLVRYGADTERLALPDGSSWFLEPDAGGALEGLEVLDAPDRALEPWEVRVAVEASGLNFWDVFRSLALIDEGVLGGETCGRVLEVGSDVTEFAVGDRVAALAFGTWGPESVMHQAMVAHAPSNATTTQLATMPTVFVSAALSYDLAKLRPGERVLVHAGAGGVGLAAIQLAHAAGAEVFATASAPKQAYLRSLGVENVYDSRTTNFGTEILDDTGGQGVHVVLNSLTGEGFIDSSLSCLARGGRFIELARVGIFTPEEMAEARPDVDYHILELDTLKEHEPETPGTALRDVMGRVDTGELSPLVHSRWSMGEAGPAMKFMRAARHIGKIVLANSPLESGSLRSDRTYLVTGGLGGIGCALAGWLAERGAGAIVLNGRRDPDPQAVEAIEELRAAGASVHVELADVTDPDSVDAMLGRIDANLPPLAGVIHSVGVLSDAALTNQTWDSFSQVVWPKAVGAWHLHKATIDLDLDLFILFSSVAGVMGNAGQANHAAANAFLDQLAAHRRAIGLPGQSIAWGAWSELGEAEEQRERIAAQLEAAGTGWITPRQGLRALEEIVRQDSTAAMVAAVDWPTFAQNHDESSQFLDDLLTASAQDTAQAEEPPESLMARLQTVRTGNSEDVLASFLQSELQAVMRLPDSPSQDVGFFELGMDSLMAVELRNRLNRAFEGEYVVSNTAVFDFPNVAALARHLAEELGSGDAAASSSAPQAAAPPAQASAPSVSEGDVAIIGMSCRFPRSKTLAEFWSLLESGVNAVTDGRPDGAGDPGLRGAFVDDIEWFDSRFFRIAPIEARMMDPRQRMMLETSWEALEDAGIDPEGLRGSLTGVYAGVGGSEYRDLIEGSGKADSYLGTTASVTAGRVAFALGLEGPAMAIDMACASSLASVHQASVALQRGEVDLALAGGVQVVLSRAVTDYMTEVGMLSRSGRCSPFDASADGYVRGEGCGMLVLKRLADAESDGDRIWAVVKGSAVNQNGASAGLTVPNGPAQERVMETALARAGVSGADVDYLEAHATGSQLGDAIEAHAVGSVYGKGREAERPLLIGTVKSNLGHLEAAAGVAGLMKTVLAMKQRTIPKHLHFDNPNPQIDWDDLPLQVTSESTPWPEHAGRPPRASVSAFGISGTNAHVVVEGYGIDDTGNGAGDDMASFAGQPSVVTPSETAGERGTRLLPLSGKTDESLRDLAGRYLYWLDERDPGAASLADAAWTAAIGRSHFDHRAAAIFDDAHSLRLALRKVAGATTASGDFEPLTATRPAFVYGDDGSLRPGMGKELYDTEPVARAVLDRCEAVVYSERGTSLLEVMFGGDGDAGDLANAAWAQPALYALACAQTALWAAIGVRPGVVLGVGTGELAAAQAAGVFSLEDGLRFVLARGTLMGALPGVDPDRALDGLEAAITPLTLAPPSTPIVSGVTARLVDSDSPLDAAYWRRQARETARPSELAAALASLGVDAVIEIGPGSTLCTRLMADWPARAPDGSETARPPTLVATAVSPVSGQSDGGHAGFVDAVAGAYEAGFAIAFEGLFAGEARRRVGLPTYPFQRRRHWFQ